MTANVQSAAAQEPVFELKSGHFTLPVLRLLQADLEALDEQLLARIKQAPGFFRNAPVVIDMSQLAKQQSEVDFALLVGLMRGYGMVPVALQGGTPKQQEMAEFLELAILAGNKPITPPDADRSNQAKPALKSAVAKLITRPIRSGQRAYAAGRDLIVLASVSSGAEVIADGNIHVYGTLRGRALAGVRGNREARIFCQKLKAELVAIAGQYRVSDQLEAFHSDTPAQVYMSEKKLLIEKI
jgi:septum site-determining protein MinC